MAAIILIALLVIILLVLMYMGRQVVDTPSTTVTEESRDPGERQRTGRHEPPSEHDPGGDGVD